MKDKEKEMVEFRYYEMPQGMSVLALLGEKWETQYGTDSMHFHNYMEIGYCYDGEGWMCLGGRMVPYCAGSITVIPKKFPHRTVVEKQGIQKWEYLFVDVEKFILQSMPGQTFKAEQLIERLEGGMFVLNADESGENDFLIKSIFEEMRNKGELYYVSVKAKLMALLIELVRSKPKEEFDELVGIQDKGLESVLSVLEYIEKNYQEDISIEQMLNISHMSETHFRRKFKEYFHTSPSEYLNLVRIKRACELLECSDAKIADVALRSGYQTTGSFIRNFKKIVGELPKDWRKTAKKKVDNPVNYNISVLKGG